MTLGKRWLIGIDTPIRVRHLGGLPVQVRNRRCRWLSASPQGSLRLYGGQRLNQFWLGRRWINGHLLGSSFLQEEV